MRFFKLTILALFILIVSGPTSIALSKPSVVATIYPLHSIAAAIMDGLNPPELLIDANVSPHHFSLKPSQVKKLQSSDLILWVGPDIEFPLTKVVKDLPSKRYLTLAEHIPYINNDPHIWLGPENAKLISDLLVDRLINIDPSNKIIYEQNSKIFKDKLDTLVIDIENKLSTLNNVPYLVMHNAFRYFERRFNLNNSGSIFADGHHHIGAKGVAHAEELIKTAKPHCVFTEPQLEFKLLRSITSKHPIRIGILDPIGADLKSGPDGYFQLLNKLTTGYITCLSNKQSPPDNQILELYDETIGHEDHHDEHEGHEGHEDHHDEHEGHEGHEDHHDEHEGHEGHEDHHD